MQVELTTLPEYAGEYRIDSRAEPHMVVAGYHLQPVHAAADEPFEEVAPVDFGFAPSDRSVQNVPIAVVIYAYCHEKGLFDD